MQKRIKLIRTYEQTDHQKSSKKKKKNHQKIFQEIK